MMVAVNIDDPIVTELLGNVQIHVSKPVKRQTTQNGPDLQKQDTVELVKVYAERSLQVRNMTETKRIYQIGSDDKIRDLDHMERDMTWEITKSVSEQKHRVREQLEKELKKIDTHTKELESHMFQVEKIIYLLKQAKLLEKNGDKFDPAKVINQHSGSQQFISKIDEYKDELLHLAVFVAKNKKPVNRYDIIVFGYSYVGSSIWQSLARRVLEIPHDYGCNGDCRISNFKKEIGSYPSIEDAQNFYKTRGIKSILRDFFNKYNVIKQEYKFVSENYTLEQFKSIQLKEDEN